jgi:hypothetical protein
MVTVVGEIPVGTAERIALLRMRLPPQPSRDRKCFVNIFNLQNPVNFFIGQSPRLWPCLLFPEQKYRRIFLGVP